MGRVATFGRHQRLQDWTLLLTTTALFAPGFTLIDITVTTITPLSMTGGRLLLATGVLYAWTRALGHSLPPWCDETGRLSVHWRFFAVLGLAGNVLPVTLITWGQQAVNAGLSAILVGLMPLMTLALTTLCVRSEPVTRRHLGGFVVGFVGIGVLTGPEALGGAARHSLIHEGAILGGALCFALNAVLIKQMPSVHPLTASVGISLCAALIAVPLALLLDAPWTLTPSALSLVGLGLLSLLPSVLATVTYVRLVRTAGPTFAALHSYLVPPLAVLLSIVFLGQRLEWNAYVALTLILAGVAASQGQWRWVTNIEERSMTRIEPGPSEITRAVLDAVATLRGHFLYESGHHGELWLDLDALFVDARRARGWVSALAHQARTCRPEVVCGPLTGGTFVAQSLAAEIGTDFAFAERRVSDMGVVRYRIPESLRETLRGRRVLLVDDAVNAGSAWRSTLTDVLDCGAEIVGFASLLTSGEAASHIVRQHGVPLFTLASLECRMWVPEACPLCSSGVPLIDRLARP